MRKHPRSYAVGLAAGIIAVIVALVLATSGGGGLDPSQVQATVQQEYPSAGGSPIHWTCAWGTRGDNTPGMACGFTSHAIKLLDGFSEPTYDIRNDGNGCWSGRAEYYNSTFFGVPESISSCQ